MDIYAATIAVSILIYIAVGNYAGRGVKRLDDFYVAGRRAPTLLIVGTLIASMMSTTMFLGEAGFAYDGQAGPYVIWPQTTAAGYVIGAILFGRYLRRSRATTVAEFFGKRFASARVQALAGFTIIFALSGYLLAVTQGAAILLSQLTGLSYLQAIVVAWLSYTTFTMYSGSRGVILTDTLMFLLFTFASFAAIVFLLVEFGGWPTMIEGLVAIENKPGLMSWHGVIGPGTEWPTPMDYLIWGLAIDISWVFVIAVSPWQASRHLMAKNEHVVLRAACIACVVAALMQAFVYGMGGAINLAKSDIVPYESATIWMSLTLLPAFLGALLLAGFMAAALSSASTFLSLVGFSASNDVGVYKKHDEKKKLRFSRMMMVVIGTVALLAALVFPPNIFWLTTFIATVFASSWGPVGIMSIWSKRITESAAFWGMLSGLVFNVVPKFFEYIGILHLPSYFNPVILGATASLVVTFTVSRFTIRSEEETTYLSKLHELPAEEKSSSKARLSLIAAAFLFANGAIMTAVHLYYYVHPYQSATGTLSADGSLDWFAGEALFAMCWFLVYGSLGLWAARVFRKEYSPAS